MKMENKYILKKEYFRKTITIKKRFSSTQYSLWNLTPKMAEFLFHNGYEYLFNVNESPEEEKVISTDIIKLQEDNKPSNEEIKVNEEDNIVSEEVKDVKPKRKSKKK